MTPVEVSAAPVAVPAPAPVEAPTSKVVVADDEDEDRIKRPGRPTPHKLVPVAKRVEPRRREGKLTITAALDDDDRGSNAAVRWPLSNGRVNANA